MRFPPCGAWKRRISTKYVNKPLYELYNGKNKKEEKIVVKKAYEFPDIQYYGIQKTDVLSASSGTDNVLEGEDFYD